MQIEAFTQKILKEEVNIQDEKENIQENLYSKYLIEDNRVDPESECNDKRIIYKMNLSTKRVQTNQINGDGAKIMDKLFTEIDEEVD
jgi:hypothetical protein